MMEVNMKQVYRDDFTAYADVCFREFGDRAKYWTTMTQPNIISFAGYDQGNCPAQSHLASQIAPLGIRLLSRILPCTTSSWLMPLLTTSTTLNIMKHKRDGRH